MEYSEEAYLEEQAVRDKFYKPYNQAKDFCNKQEELVKFINEVYEGREILTPAVYAQCQAKMMGIKQMHAVVSRRLPDMMNALVELKPELSKEWREAIVELGKRSRAQQKLANERFKEIITWATEIEAGASQGSAHNPALG